MTLGDEAPISGSSLHFVGTTSSDLLESSHYQISHFSRCTYSDFNRSFIDEGELDIFQRYVLFCKDAGCKMLGLRFMI